MKDQWTVEAVEADEAVGSEESLEDQPLSDPMDIGEAFEDPDGDEGDAEEGADASKSDAQPIAEPQAGEEQPKPDQAQLERVLPAYWGEEEKKAFSELPPEVQGVALQFEKGREAFVSRKSQELSRATEKAAGAAQLAEMMQGDPEFRAHVLSFNQQQNTQTTTEQPPEDPFERIKWDAEQAAMQKVQPQIQQMQDQQRVFQQKQRIDSAKSVIQQDDHYGAVHKAIADEVQDVANKWGKDEAARLYARLDSDPEYYLERYNALRPSIVEAAKQPGQPEHIETLPKGRTVTEKAPILEGAGAEQQGGGESTRKLKEARKRVRSGHGSLRDIGALFGDAD